MIDIVIPYLNPYNDIADRPHIDRESQLAELMAHLPKYLTDQGLDWLITIVEDCQDSGQFNRGLIKNIGAVLTEGTDIIFHDCDYVPIRADYAEKADPTRLISHGLQEQDRLNLNEFWGGVVQVPRRAFLKANGYSVRYPYWGWEDTDFRVRLEVTGHDLKWLPGEFRALAHPHMGLMPDGVMKSTTLDQEQMFRQRLSRGFQGFRQWMEIDGLNTLDYELVSRCQRAERVQHILVDTEPWLDTAKPYWRANHWYRESPLGW